MTEENLNTWKFQKKIDLVQNIITRLASNSFKIKGWTISLIVGTFLVQSTKYFSFIALLPIIGFWILDTYYLRQERLYRAFYSYVVSEEVKSKQISLELNLQKYTNKIKEWQKDAKNYFSVMFSKTIGIFYGLLGVLVIIYSIMLIITLGNSV